MNTANKVRQKNKDLTGALTNDKMPMNRSSTEERNQALLNTVEQQMSRRGGIENLLRKEQQVVVDPQLHEKIQRFTQIDEKIK